MGGEPEGLGGGAPGVDDDAGLPTQRLDVAGLLGQRDGLVTGAAVRPQDAAPQRVQVRVDGHERLARGGEADCRHGLPARVIGVARVRAGGDDRAPPVVRVLLGPPRLRVQRAHLGAAHGHGAGVGPHDGLGGAAAEVEGQDHAASQARVSVR